MPSTDSSHHSLRRDSIMSAPRSCSRRRLRSYTVERAGEISLFLFFLLLLLSPILAPATAATGNPVSLAIKSTVTCVLAAAVAEFYAIHSSCGYLLRTQKKKRKKKEKREKETDGKL